MPIRDIRYNHFLESIMRIIKTASLVSGFIGLSAVLASTAAMSATGKGLDVFNMGLGEPVPAVATAAAAPGKGSPGKGWDVMRTGAGEPLPDYGRDSRGESSHVSAGKGWDVFNMGLGDPIPASKQRPL
jgi:hypothetical protein